MVKSSGYRNPLLGLILDIKKSNLKKAWRFEVTFAGNLPPRTYLSPNVWHSDPGWGSEVFNRPIDRLEFFLPIGGSILLSGMVAYCFFVEASKGLSGKSKTRIEAFWICGRPPSSNTVEMWRIAKGKAVRQQKRFGAEWGGSPVSGWKAGIIGGDPISTLITSEARHGG